MATQIQLHRNLTLESKYIWAKHIDSNNANKAVKRSRMEILAEILFCCNQQKAKTKIMYQANLNYTQLQTQLKFLSAQGMLSKKSGKYATTEKGLRFLGLYTELQYILNSEI